MQNGKKASNIRRLAKSRLSANRLQTAVAVLLCRAVLIFCGFLPFLLRDGLLRFLPEGERSLLSAVSALLVSVVICACLRLGREAFFFSLAKEGKASLRLLFSFFMPRRVPYALRCWLLHYSVRTVRFVIFFLPFAASAAVMIYRLSRSGMSAAVLTADGLRTAALLGIGAVFFGIFNAGDFLYFRLVSSSQEMTAGRAYRLSRQKMGKTLFRAAGFGIRHLLFVPAYLFTVPYIFLYRYSKMCRCLKALDGFEPGKHRFKKLILPPEPFRAQAPQKNIDGNGII